MASKLDEESRMSIRVLQRRGVAIRETARILGVTEGAVRYHLRRQREGATDGRSRQVSKAEALRDPILRWVEARRSQGQGLNHLLPPRTRSVCATYQPLQIPSAQLLTATPGASPCAIRGSALSLPLRLLVCP